MSTAEAQAAPMMTADEFLDWDGDGHLDILLNSQNADWLRNVGQREGRLALLFQ